MKIKNTVVIIPVYAGDKIIYLKEAVGSILKQTFKDFSLFIGVDGPISEDIKNYIENIPFPDLHIKYFNENKGLPHVLNQLISYCIEKDVEFIVRMDADDISSVNRLEKQIDYLKRNKQVAVVGCSAYIVDENSNIIGERKVPKRVTFGSMIFRSQIVHPSVVFRTSFFLEVGFYDTKLKHAQDYDLWLRALKHQMIIHSLNDKYYFSRHDSNLIERRKTAQKYNLIVKKKHFKGIKYFISILPHLVIFITPKGLIRFLLKKSIKTPSQY